jgi:hypothetical protein
MGEMMQVLPFFLANAGLQVAQEVREPLHVDGEHDEVVLRDDLVQVRWWT